MCEIFGNELHMFFECDDELIEAIQTTAFDFGYPFLNGASRTFPGLFCVEDLGQFLA